MKSDIYNNLLNLKQLVDSCCSMPKLLPFDVFKACFGGTPGAGEVEKVAFKAKINGKSRKTRETGIKKLFSQEMCLKYLNSWK